jgi:hypothetical protein
MGFLRSLDSVWLRRIVEATKSHLYVVCIAVVQLFLACLYFYWCTHLPSTGKAVLVIGIVAVLMTFDMAKPLKGACLVLVFALAFLENKSIDKDRTIAKADQDAAFAIARNTANTVTQTLTSVTLLRSQVDDYSSQMREADRNHDVKLVAQLRTEKEAAQKQLLLAMLPGALKEMEYWAHRWELDDNDLVLMTDRARGDSSPQSASRVSELLQKKVHQDITYTSQVLPIMTSANYLREQLLRGSTETLEDKRNAAVFAKVLAGGPISWGEMRIATVYMENLSKKFALTSSP